MTIGSNEASDVNRRRLMATLGGMGALGTAGCLGETDDDDPGDDDFEDDDDDPGNGVDEDDDDDPAPEPDELPTGQTLDIAVVGEVNPHDPAESADATTNIIFNNTVYEPLLVMDWEGVPQPNLITELERINDTTFEAELREGVQFHNGEEMTATDVVSTFERYEGAAREADVYDWYESSEEIGEYAVEINLMDPYSQLEAALTGVQAVPEAAAEDELDLYETPTGTGAYVVDEHVPDEVFRVTHFEDHWFDGNDEVPGTPPVEQVNFRIVPEPSTRFAALEVDDVHVIDELPPNHIPDVEENPELELDSHPLVGYEMLTYSSNEPFNNKKVRQGIARMMPREAVIEVAHNGIGEPAYTPVSPVFGEVFDEDFANEMKEEYVGHDEDRGLELLEEGFAEVGIEPPHEATMISEPRGAPTSEIVLDTLNSTEYFDISHDQLERGTWLEAILSESFQEDNLMAVITLTLSWDPIRFLETMGESGNQQPACCNFFGYENDDVDRLIQEAYQTFDTGEMQEKLNEAQRQFVSDAPAILIRYGEVVHGLRESVQQWETNASGGWNSVYEPMAGKFTYLEE